VGDIALTMTTPNGVRVDLTPRTDLRAFSAVGESLESDFLELTHGDFDLTLDDQDGELSAMFEGATEEEEYILEIDLYRGERRVKWERIWGGILEIPRTLSENPKERTLSVQGYSYSKLLERASAENVKREVGGLLADGVGGIATITLTSGTTADIRVDDIVTLDDAANTEDNRVAAIVSPTVITTRDVLNTSYSDAELLLKTPYYRRRSIEDLAALLFAEAGVTSGGVDLAGTADTLAPFPTPVSTEGLPSSGNPQHLMARGALVEMQVSAGQGSFRAVDAKAGWVSENPAETPKIDYSNQQDAEPTLLAADATLGDAPSATGAPFLLFRAADYATGDYYDLEQTADFRLRKNGAFLATIEAGFVAEGGAIVWDSTHSRLLVHYRETGVAQPATLKAWTGAALETLSTGAGGGIYMSLGYDHRLDLALFHSAEPGKMWVYMIEAGSIGRRFRAPGNHRYLYGLRSIGNHFAFCYRQAEGDRYHTHLAVYDYGTLDKVADVRFQTGSVTNPPVFVTRMHLGEEDVLFAFSGRSSGLIVARHYAGVVGYADFEGNDCGAALRDLALLGLSFLHVDIHRIGRLIARANMAGAQAFDDVVLEQTTLPLSPESRTSAQVTGETDDGEEIEVTLGKTGDSANRIDIDSKFINTTAMATALGSAYSSLLSGLRERTITIERPARLYHANDLIAWDGAVWRVISASYEVDSQDQELRLIEVPS
jgi:hypothetical protein